MRGSLLFIGGVMVGLGLATSLLAVWVGWALHHMFIMGVSSWPRLVAMMVVPLLLIAVGAGLAWSGRDGRMRS